MAPHTCPVWVGYLLLNPLRRWLENPATLLAPHVKPGMMVLEPGCALGFFTLPLARLVGPAGKVIAVDLQPKMLAGLKKRAHRAGLLDRIEARLSDGIRLGLEDLEGRVDFCAAIHMIHEVEDQAGFFSQVARALNPGGKLLLLEPKGHVKAAELDRTLLLALEAGLETLNRFVRPGGRGALLIKRSSD